jgi:hypothetical protein
LSHHLEHRGTSGKRATAAAATVVALLTIVCGGSTSQPAAARGPDVVLVGDSIVGGNRLLIDPVFAARGLELYVDALGQL